MVLGYNSVYKFVIDNMVFGYNSVYNGWICISDERRTPGSTCMPIFHNHQVYYLSIPLKVLNKLFYQNPIFINTLVSKSKTHYKKK